MRKESKFGSFVEEAESGLPLENIIDRCRQNQLSQIPVTSRGEFIGLLDAGVDAVSTGGDMADELLIHPQPLKETERPCRFWEEIAKNRLSVIPLCDDSLRYIGSIRTVDFVRHYKAQAGTDAQGCLILCTLRASQFSLLTLAQVLEEHHLLLCSLLRIDQPEDEMLVVIHLGEDCGEALINDLQRHYFEPIMFFSSEHIHEPLKDRYDELMRYLNV